VGSLDPSSVARIYTIIRPRLIEVSEFIGRGDSNLDGKVEAAIVLLLQTPSTGETVELVPGRGNTYAYADARLESLKPAQKHLLRMGPANARIVKDKIRAIASELGMAEATLPR
jgi:hypothetical protein